MPTVVAILILAAVCLPAAPVVLKVLSRVIVFGVYLLLALLLRQYVSDAIHSILAIQ
jgi:hypothetical protein